MPISHWYILMSYERKILNGKIIALDCMNACEINIWMNNFE